MTLSKNGKRLGRPRGSRTKPASTQDGRRLNQAKIIGELEGRLSKVEYENFLMRKDRESVDQVIQKLRKELAEAQIAVLDGIAVIRYLEKKVYDLLTSSKEK